MDYEEWRAYKQGYLAAWAATIASVKRMADNMVPPGKMSLKLASHLEERLSIWQRSELQYDPPECAVTFPEPAEVRDIKSTLANVRTPNKEGKP
ncbi:MAG: hypothetical protein NT005_02815 [Spirochaetes bacterium]|nr:hypothetical protein [Spirochaetota bacterium]